MQNNGKKNIRHVVSALSLALSLSGMHSISVKAAEVAIEQMSEAARIEEALFLFHQFLDASQKDIGFMKSMNRIIDLLKGTIYSDLAIDLENIIQCRTWKGKLTQLAGYCYLEKGQAAGVCEQLLAIPATHVPEEIKNELKFINKTKGPGYMLKLVQSRLTEDKK